MLEIFGENILKKQELAEEFLSLLGEKPEKPFECVGTIEEARAAFSLLKGQPSAAQRLLRAWNPAHNIPARYLPAVERMHAYVGAIA